MTLPKRSGCRERLLRAVALGLALALHGCSYAISPEVVAKADRSVTFDMLTADTAPFVGKTVILGGIIVGTRNLKKGSLIEVVQKDLDYWGKPQRTDRSGGRFLILHPAFLDAMIYAPGRAVTVAGEVMAEEQKVQGVTVPAYLLVKTRELKLWPGRTPAGWDRPEWLDPLYDPDTKPGRYGH